MSSENEMEEAAERARLELEAHIATWTATELCRWWAEHYLEAGHKRLGRLLVKAAKA